MRLHTFLASRARYREPFPPQSSGTFIDRKDSQKVIRLLLKGCTNRPFYHIAVQDKTQHFSGPVIEQLGSYDPMPNKFNEKLCALNYERIQYWLKKGAEPTIAIREILGLAGYFPIHFTTTRRAWLHRKRLLEEIEKQKEKLAKQKESNESGETSQPEQGS